MRSAAEGGARNTYDLSRGVPRSLIAISTFTTERSADPSGGVIDAKGSNPSLSDRSISTSPPASRVQVRVDPVVVVTGAVVVGAVVCGGRVAVASGGRVSVASGARTSEPAVHADAINTAARTAHPLRASAAFLGLTYGTSTKRTL